MPSLLLWGSCRPARPHVRITDETCAKTTPWQPSTSWHPEQREDKGKKKEQARGEELPPGGSRQALACSMGVAPMEASPIAAWSSSSTAHDMDGTRKRQKGRACELGTHYECVDSSIMASSGKVVEGEKGLLITDISCQEYLREKSDSPI